jgi:hypothetical protein
MNPSDTNLENCAVCGKSTEGSAAFAHLYHHGRRFPLCCPLCVDAFERHRDRFAQGACRQTLLEEIIADMKWKNPPY